MTNIKHHSQMWKEETKNNEWEIGAAECTLHLVTRATSTLLPCKQQRKKEQSFRTENTCFSQRETRQNYS